MPKPVGMTKAGQQARWDKCIRYLEKNPDMPATMKAAAKNGVYYNTSVWIAALGKMLERGRRPGDRGDRA